MILLAYVYRVAKLKRRAEKEVASWLKAMLIFYLPLRSTGICASNNTNKGSKVSPQFFRPFFNNPHCFVKITTYATA
jgi:hypothetical protein